MADPIAIVLERDNVNDETVTLVRWFAEEGEKVDAGALLAEVETSKANIEVRAEAGGYLMRSFRQGQEVPVGGTIGYLVDELPTSAPAAGGKTAEAEPTPRPAAAGRAREAEGTRAESQPGRTMTTVAAANGKQADGTGLKLMTRSGHRQRISPLAQRMMAEYGLKAEDFADFSLVRKQDILDCVQPKAVSAARSQAAVRPTPVTQPHRRVALSKSKRREGENLLRGSRNAVTSVVTVNCATRGFRSAVERRIPGGSGSAVILFEVSRLLRKFPSLNATWQDGEMVAYEQVNLGVAMDDGSGLKVVVIEECDRLSLVEVTERLRDLTLAYLGNKLKPADIANATFTVSDLSGMQVSSFVPVISENQGAILGVGCEQFFAGSRSGFFSLNLAFDHQLSDGRTAAQFLNELKDRLAAYEAAATGKAEEPEAQCVRCVRTAGELRRSGHFLVHSVVPEGYLCSLCLGGF